MGRRETKEESLPLSGASVPCTGVHGPPFHQPLSPPWAVCQGSLFLGSYIPLSMKAFRTGPGQAAPSWVFLAPAIASACQASGLILTSVGWGGEGHRSPTPRAGGAQDQSDHYPSGTHVSA